MRSTFFGLLFLVGAAALSAGCSRSDGSGKPDAAGPGSPSRTWASDSEPAVVEPAPPLAADRSAAPADDVSSDFQTPKQASEADALPGEPAARVPQVEKMPGEPPLQMPPSADSGRDGARPSIPSEEGLPPADAFPSNPAAATPSEPPPLHNPLRELPPGADSANPMRPTAAPLPDFAAEEPTTRTDLPGPAGPPAGSEAGDPSHEIAARPSVATSPSPPNTLGSQIGGATDQKAEEKFDPIKENGPIFEGWTRPKLALVITGREDGYIEPCGCAGLDKMKGGLSRRHTMIRSLREEKGWPLVCVDVGGLIKGYGPQTEIKFQRTIDALRKMGYDAIGFGANDLLLPVPELVSATAEPSPFVSANVGLFGFDANINARTKIIEAGGLKVGVTAVLGKKYQGEINNQEIETAAAEDALEPLVTPLRKACNLLVLLAYATREESIALGQKFPDFQLVVTAGGPSEPPAEPARIPETRSLLIEVGEKGAHAIVVGLYDNPQRPLRYQRVPLDSRFAASKDMHRIMVAYQDELQRRGLEGLEVHAVSHPQAELLGAFVGSEKCKSCHEESYRVWKKSLHATAWKSLCTADPPRNFDPECISCHVVGWHPTKFFPYKTGFMSQKQTPELVNVGCESCHGPGGAHCKAEDGCDLALQEKLYEAIRVTKEEAQNNLAKMCQNCHDLDNSPEFKFETYFPKIEHYENKDEEK